MHDKSLEYIFERGYNDCRCCVLLGSPGFLERMSSDQKTTMVMLLQLILPRAFRRLFDEAPIEEEIEGLSSKRLIAVGVHSAFIQYYVFSSFNRSN